ncbi:hypothetical protein QBC46DRAFT_381095 [Diplogelasinospora grovesii]|uniref:Secreted protein n=1 Tax=Diplogelasinospora grovesii TaxID=303347 RepID=A0AAN6S5N8_9PEZI|nr:hypothetical protein QBC46DRAFT_381095 [Diplogelasinospora grovesii]
MWLVSVVPCALMVLMIFNLPKTAFAEVVPCRVGDTDQTIRDSLAISALSPVIVLSGMPNTDGQELRVVCKCYECHFHRERDRWTSRSRKAISTNQRKYQTKRDCEMARATKCSAV